MSETARVADGAKVHFSRNPTGRPLAGAMPPEAARSQKDIAYCPHAAASALGFGLASVRISADAATQATPAT